MTLIKLESKTKYDVSGKIRIKFNTLDKNCSHFSLVTTLQYLNSSVTKK